MRRPVSSNFARADRVVHENHLCSIDGRDEKKSNGSVQFDTIIARMAPSDAQNSRRKRLLGLGFCTLLLFGSTQGVRAIGLDACREQFREGRYGDSLDTAQNAIDESAYQPRWRVLLIESLLALGRYEEAVDRIGSVLIQYPLNITLLKLAHTVYTDNGQDDLAREMLEKIYRIASARRLAFVSNTDLVALGQALLLLGAEPRTVLRDFYNRALQNDPNCREAYLAFYPSFSLTGSAGTCDIAIFNNSGKLF